ncbi:dTDP-4-dehydrorhamnose reductase [Coleofasciculus sp. FACHB-T130]|uniref:dTDP-4-dehydrorhamnose reductase n=1 Tax=Cyanophyceae TaxID=3028117 RepID=UPI001686FCF9|nr:dTDP-4-dehydrorhamnose reductase [Coleofasciculus sp. FACHB-T130]MBD1878322.1 dTDP-4-dehydrorhamnose reductase [Coleofasciculus sp. FACHB-T130]
MTRILLIGCTGQVGKELQQTLAPYQEIVAVGRPTVDLSQPDILRQIIGEVQPQIIINAAAYTAVDKAESEPELAKGVNAIAPSILAQEAQKQGSFLIHISTDYVFDGSQSHPYGETDATNPVSVYGESKLAGEEAIRETCTQHLIFRTAWVYGTHGKSNFVKTMLRLGGEQEEVRVVADQIGSPTWAKDLAQAIAQLIPHLTPEIAGTYHYTNSGVASWYDFAVAIFEEAKHVGFPLKVQRIIPITTAEYPTPAHRPAYSVLSCGKISAVMGTYPPHWRQGLRQMLLEYIGDESFNSLRR